MVSTEGDDVESVVASVDCIKKAAKRHFLNILIIIIIFLFIIFIVGVIIITG